MTLLTLSIYLRYFLTMCPRELTFRIMTLHMERWWWWWWSAVRLGVRINPTHRETTERPHVGSARFHSLSTKYQTREMKATRYLNIASDRADYRSIDLWRRWAVCWLAVFFAMLSGGWQTNEPAHWRHHLADCGTTRNYASLFYGHFSKRLFFLLLFTFALCL